MTKKGQFDKEETQDKAKLSNGNPLIPQTNILYLSDKKEGKVEYFLGYKLKNVNQLWRWDTLESVNF